MPRVQKVYIVGAGPGRADLITLRGLNILKEAEVIIYDYLIAPEILDFAKEGAELICCDKLAKKGRYSDGFLIHQGKITDLLIKKTKEGKKVVRLKNGDPAIFGRFSQELEALVKNGIEFEIIPGVTAASAASSYSGIPLTDRRWAFSCIFITGHLDPKKEKSAYDWKAIAKSGTIVFYMAVENLPWIVKELIKAGKDKKTPCAIVSNASLATQKTITGTLADIVTPPAPLENFVEHKGNSLTGPAIVIIGEVVRLEKRFNWLKKNKRILFTGLSRERFFLKGSYFHLPLIKIVPLVDYREFDYYLGRIQSFDWVVFSSRYGVEYFFQRLKKIGYDIQVLSGIKIAAIGDSTCKRLLDFEVVADLLPKDESSKGLLTAFRNIDIKNKKIFLPRSDIADKGLAQGFKKIGAMVTASIVYRNVAPRNLPDLELSSFDEIMFTSPSGVRNFIRRYGRPAKDIKISCIGEVTRKEAKKWHLI